MFDIGFSELVVIGIVALVVLGPERLPKAARFAGLWVRKARAQWYSMKAELERELAAEELKQHAADAREVMRGLDDSVRATHDALRRDLTQAVSMDPAPESESMQAQAAPEEAPPAGRDEAEATRQAAAPGPAQEGDDGVR